MEAEQRTPAELDLDLERYGLLDEDPLEHRSAGRLVDQAVDRLVPFEGLEQGQGALAVPLDDRAGDRDGGADAAAPADVAHGEREPDQVPDVGRLVDGDRLGAPQEQGDAAEG